jgi:presenilin-like A22 family membrane protease
MVARSLERMAETVTILLFLLSAVLIASGCHALVKRYFLASFVAACGIVVGIQVASYIELGHIDPFWQISSVTGFFMASIIALIVGIPFRIKRKVKHEDI